MHLAYLGRIIAVSMMATGKYVDGTYPSFVQNLCKFFRIEILGHIRD
jgi:hypothetical protein